MKDSDTNKNVSIIKKKRIVNKALNQENQNCFFIYVYESFSLERRAVHEVKIWGSNEKKPSERRISKTRQVVEARR